MAVQRGKLDPANFKPGPQNPGKYPQTGANYAQWGDVAGMQYDPWSDSYYKDKKAYEEYLYTSGQAERPKEAPGLFESVAPLAAAGGSLALAEQIGKGAAGMFGFGEAAATGATAAQGAGGVAGATGAASNLTGLQGLGAGSVAAPTGVTSQVVPVAAESGGLLSGIGGLGILPTAAIAAGTYLGGKSAYDMIRGKEDKSTMGKVGRGLLGIATGGISEIARPFAMHESTRERQSNVTNKLLEQAGDDPTAQAYVQGIRKQFESAPTGKAYAGKYDTFGEYQKAGLEAGDLADVEGNIEVYTPQEWSRLAPEQKRAITQLNIDSGLYYAKDGGVKIRDQAKALENKNKVLQGVVPAAPAPQGQAIPRPIANKDIAQKALENWK